MTAELVRAPETTRRVRVTIEGDAHVLAHNPDLLRIGYGIAGSLMVNAAEVGITVEDIDPARIWSDGDVVASRSLVWSRLDGRWHCVTAHGVSTADDTDMSAEVDAGRAQVLRYLHGEA